MQLTQKNPLRTEDESKSIFNTGRDFIRLYLKLASVSVRTGYGGMNILNNGTDVTVVL